MGEFLPIIVAIAFGIYSFLKRNMSAEDDEKRKPFSPPNLDPMHPKHFDNPKQVEAQPRPEVVIKPQVEQMYRPEHVNQKSYVKERPFKQEPIKLVKQKRVTTSMPVFTKQRLVEGVIMAEVLGPPRAQNPHHSNRARKLSK
ncbi:hypothetical protein JOC85_001563 [Bacillus mesophilus]|uniref:Uncharacterized protein n=1 Tax=Bacillus mesophilus TaxID=1808955 RepID=A0A6M0Q5T3_9BACI|nr:hypothetical protein [Bacillus mesophilus]MBM7660791.1 hypothetical protein [Bacillus mesophilus]NEY71662.1 hypothetical protein [Bacillus mesophilus]